MTHYAAIFKACQLIALDNGGINRSRSANEQRRDFDNWIKRQPSEILQAIDTWLTTLSDDDLNIVCCDSDNDRFETLIEQAPMFTDGLLNLYFDEVC